MVVGDSYFHDVVLGAQQNFHVVQEDEMVQWAVEVVEAAVAAEVSDLYALHIQKYRVLEAAMELHKDPCCPRCLQ